MAISKQDLIKSALKFEEKEKEHIDKQEEKKKKAAAAEKTETKPKTETKTETKPKTESKPKSSANNASGKAQQFSSVIDKTPTVSAKAVSSEAPTLENRDAVKKETQKNKSIFAVTQNDKINLQNREQLKSEQQTKANFEAKKFVDNILKNAANDKEIKKQVTVDNRDAVKEQIQNDVWQTNPEGSYASNLARGLGNRFRSTVGNSIEGMAGAFVDSTNDVVQGYSFGDEINLDNREAARAYAMGQNSAWFVDPLKVKAEEIAKTRNAGKVYDLATEQIASAQEGTNSQFARDMISAADSGVQTAAYMALPGGNKYLSAYMAIPAAAERYNEERAKGASKEEAATRAAATGTISYAIESLAGIGKFQSNVIEEIAAKNFFTNLAAQFVAEGGEELLDSGLQYVADVLADLMYKGEIQTTFDPSEMLHKAWVGGLSGAGFGFTGSVSNSFTGNTQQDATVKEVIDDIVVAVKNTRNTKDPSHPGNTPAEQPVSPVEAPIAEAKNVTPETANEQEGAFANVGEKVEAENQNGVAEAPEKTLETLKEQFDKGEISKEEYLAKNYENLSKYFDERKKSNAQVNSTDDAIKPENDAIEPTNAQPRAQKNIPQEMVAPKNRAVEVTPKKADVKAKVEETNAQNGAHPNTVGAKQRTTPFYTAGAQYGTYDPKTRQTYEGNETFKSPVRLDNSGQKEVGEAVQSFAASPLGTKEAVDYMIQHIVKFTHAIDTDADAINKTKLYLEENGLDKSLEHWKNIAKGKAKYTKDEGVLAATTIRILQEQGRINEANEMLAELNAEISTVAQATQGVETIYKILDPASIKLATNSEAYINHLVKKLNEKYADRLKKGKTITANPELLQKALESNGTDAEGNAWDKVYVDIANQVPSTFWERINNYRYFCMLSNPKTHIRNVLSNTVMQGVNIVKDEVKVLVEKVYNNTNAVKSGKLQESRTVSGKPAPKEYKNFAKEDFEAIRDTHFESGKYSENSGTFVDKHRTKINNNLLLGAIKARFKGDSKTEQLLNKVLDQGVINSAAELNSYLLNEVEDGGAKSQIYTHAMSQYMVANKLTPEYLLSPEGETDLMKARAYACAEALYNTFNEKNFISTWISSGAKGSKTIAFVSGANLPFKKVPINLAKTGFEYSPAGLISSGFEMAKAVKTQSDPGKAINDIAKGLTGTGLTVVGMILRSLGLLTNGLPEDEKEAKHEKMLGSQAFAFKVGDKSYTLDWLQPVGMMLFSGAATYDTIRDLFKGESNIIKKGDVWGTVGNVTEIGINSLLAFYEPMMEMSMLSNIKELVAPEHGRDWKGFGADIISDYTGQFVPNFLAALTKTIDDTERDTYYTDKTDAIPDTLQPAIQNVMAKTPGLSKKLPEKVDVWGNVQKRNPNVVVRAFENFISPGTYKEHKETEVDKFLKQNYAETGESVLPSSFPKNFTFTVEKDDGKGNLIEESVEKDLSSKEYVEASKVAGQTKYNMLDQLIKRDEFKKLPAEEQAKIVSDIYSFGTVKGKQAVSDYIPKAKWYGNLEKAEEKGVSPTSFLLAKNFKGNIVTEKGGKGEGLQMYDYLIADKKTDARQDLVLLETAGGVDMSKYRESSSNPENILSTYNLIQTEQMVGGDGTQQRIIKQLIADKNTTAKEDMAFVKNVLKADMENYEKASKGKDKDTLFLYNLMNTKNAKGDQKEKDADIERIQKEMKLNGREAREVYTKAQGNWHDSLNDYVAAGTDANNRKTRQARLDAFERRKWSDKDVLAGYNGLSGYGNAKKDVQIAILTEVFGSKAKATEFYNIKEGNKGYK